MYHTTNINQHNLTAADHSTHKFIAVVFSRKYLILFLILVFFRIKSEVFFKNWTMIRFFILYFLFVYILFVFVISLHNYTSFQSDFLFLTKQCCDFYPL